MCWIITNNEPHLFNQFVNGFDDSDGVRHLLLHYIDDFLGGAPTYSLAMLQYIRCKQWWEILGIPAQDRKCTPPCRILIFLGYVFNLINYTLSIPVERLNKYKQTARKVRDYFRRNKKIRNNLLQKMVGQFRSLQVVYPYIIPFLRSWEAVTSRLHKNRMVSITGKMIRDLDVVEHAVDDIARIPMKFEWVIYPRNSCDIHVYTDASTTLGVGGYVHHFGGTFFTKMWRDTLLSDQHHKPDIVFLELLGVVAAMDLFGPQFSGKSIAFHCDNYASVHMVIKKCACFRRPDLNDLLAELAKIAMKYRFYIWIEHVPGKLNDVSDGLSREIPLDECCKNLDFELAPKPSRSTDSINDLLNCWLRHRGYLRRRKELKYCICDMEDNFMKNLHRSVNKEPLRVGRLK